MSETGMVQWGSRDGAPWLSGIFVVLVLGAIWLRVAGLPSADLHGPLHFVGIMDPFCGGTRATYMLVHGDVGAAWSWNPLVPLLAVAMTVVLVRLVTGLARGRWLNVGVSRRVWLTATVVGMVVLEVNQQLQADRLMNVVPT